MRALLLVVVCAVLLPSAARAETPRVTLIGDSVMTTVQSNEEPMKILQNGLDVRMEVAVCRRLVGESCPYEGRRVQTLVERVQQMAIGHELAPTVVVEMGYNDPADTFASAVEQSLSVLRDAGAQHVWWLTLRESQGQYPGMNKVLRDAAAHHPELTLIDWNRYSSIHPVWFQVDSEHLNYDGAVGLARLIHDSVLGWPVSMPPLPAAPAPPVVLTVKAPPPARVGRAYSAHLTASGGTGPYRFRIAKGRPPAGLHLLANGRLYGRPRHAGTVRFTLEVRDAAGDVTDAPSVLVVRARPTAA